jgi:hypothetical protein
LRSSFGGGWRENESGRFRGPRQYFMKYLMFFGAGEGIRTLDPNLGKVVLYH